MVSEQAQAESEVPPIEQGRSRSIADFPHSAPISSRSNLGSRLILLLFGSLLGPLPFVQPAFADVRSGGLGTRVNGGLAGRCSSGDCRVTGGTDAGMNRFHRFGDFDTRGPINSVQIDSGGQNNVVLGVTSPLGSFINKSVALSSPAHLFLLSPGGIHLGSGANFVNTPNLTLSTANRLRFAGGVFDVHNTTVDQLAALGGAPLAGSLGLHRSIEVDDANASPNQIKLEGIDIRIDQSLFVDAPSGGVKVIASNLSAGDSAHKGGTLTLTGERVDVDGSSLLNTAGASGGGTIHLGGSWQNRDPSVRQAVKTTVALGAVLDASATQSGDGGEIVAWSDIKNPNSITDVQGSLFAKGGVHSGFGGRVETSGYDLLVDGIHVDTRSSSGPAGVWLLDPLNVEITTIDDLTTNTGGVFSPNNTPAKIAASTIETQLGTTSVTVNTTGAGGEDGDITVSVPITQNGGNLLTLEADGDIILNKIITRNGSGGLTLSAGDAIAVNANIIATGSANISLSSGTGIALNSDINQTGGGNVTLNSIVNGLTGAGDVGMGAASATLTIDQTGNTSWAGNLTGSGAGFTKRGVGELTLGGSFTQHTGNTEVERGTLKLDVDNGISQFGNNSPVNVLTGASLHLSSPVSGNSISLGKLDSAGNVMIDLRGASLEIGDDNSDSTISGVVSGTGRLIKIGSGELVLSDLTNSFGTSAAAGWPVLKISGGKVSVPDERALGSPKGADSIFIENNSTLAFTGTTTFNNARGIELSGTGGTIAVVSGATVTIPGALNGSGTLTKSDPGTLELTNNNLGYTGSVLVSGGSLTVTGTNPLAGSISCSGGSSNRGCTLAAGGGGEGSTSSQTTIDEEPSQQPPQPPVTQAPDDGGTENQKPKNPPKKNVVTEEEDTEILNVPQDVLVTTVDSLSTNVDLKNSSTISDAVLSVRKSEMTSEKFTNSTFQDIASGAKVSIEGVDVSMGESFVLGDASNDEAISEPNSPSASSSDESLDTSTNSDDSSDSTSSEDTGPTSSDGDRTLPPPLEAKVLAPDVVMMNLSTAISSKRDLLMDAFGINKPPVDKVTAPLIQGALINERERVRNAP